VIWNLLSNAIQVHAARRHVTLAAEKCAPTASRRLGGVRITVSDDGVASIGVRAVHLRPLPPGGQHQQARHGGLGWAGDRAPPGRAARGTVEVESAGEQRARPPAHAAGRRDGDPGAPSETRAARRPRARQPTPDASIPKSTSAAVRVLLVDDEPDARELFAEVLEQYGAASPVPARHEALMLLREQRPTVLLSDIGLPARMACR